MPWSDTAFDGELPAEYAAATLEYAVDPDFALWESTVGDGLDDPDDLEPSEESQRQASSFSWLLHG